MSRFLGAPLPDGRSAEYIARILPARRAARSTSDYDGESLQVMWTGHSQDLRTLPSSLVFRQHAVAGSPGAMVDRVPGIR